jgi:hypothetical protein
MVGGPAVHVSPLAWGSTWSCHSLQAVLRTARLPSLMSLTESGDPRAQQLWGLHVEAVLDFEAKLRPFLGASGLQV